MSYIIPTNDPDYVYPEGYGSYRKPMHEPHVVGDPRYGKGNIVMFNHGIYVIRKEPKRRTARHGKGKGDYIYDIGTPSPAAENKLHPVDDRQLRQLFKLQRL